MGGGLQILNFICHKDAPSISQLMADIETPSVLDYSSDLWKSDTLKLIDESLIRFCEAWGRPYGFIQEQNGAIIQNLFPIKSNENEQISSSSKITLEMHTETAFHPWRPQYVILLCLRGDDRAGTTYAVLDDIVQLLDKETIDILHEPVFTTTLDKSFQNPNQPDAVVTTPILFNNATSMTYDRVLMKPVNTYADAALTELSRAIEMSKQIFHLSSGQIAIIENWKVVHGRTPFTPRYDGRDRWLKRVMVRRSMPPQFEIQDVPETDHYVVTTTF
jgi:alpha-ketoglutarate-dependent taurine dioxygenase